MTQPEERRSGNVQLQRQVDQLESKIDRLDDRIEGLSATTKATIEAMTKIIDERWRSMEQRFDMTGRQQQQSIDMLVTTAQRLEMTQGSLDTKADLLESDMRIVRNEINGAQKWGQGEHEHIYERINRIDDTLKWQTRTIAAALLSSTLAVAGGVILFFITH